MRLEAYAFSGCENLKEISIPDSLLKNKTIKPFQILVCVMLKKL